MTTEPQNAKQPKQSGGKNTSRRVRLRGFRRFFDHYAFSSLTRRILILNFAALGVLVFGILYMNQFREGLIHARTESLMTQAEIIAGAIASSADVEVNSIRIDPERLLELQAGSSIAPSPQAADDFDFPINPDKVGPVLRRLISPTLIRARLYDRDANIILDSRHLYSGGQILRYDLPPVDAPSPRLKDRFKKWFAGFFGNSDLPLYRENPGGSGVGYPEVMSALTGQSRSVVQVSEHGELIVSVAVPIQRFRAVLGVLMLSTQGGEIDRIVYEERKAVFRVFGVAAIVTALLSLLLASTIANPLRKLADAAVKVRRGTGGRESIPDFSDRHDEIGNLSVAVREMTSALYARIDAIERFAADVAHELKNPLTSLRSAVETLPLARTEDSKKRLLDVIQHDVRRLDRLISDISDASRLDAELTREDAAIFDLEKLLEEIVNASRQASRRRKPVKISMKVDEKGVDRKKRFKVSGHDLRIGQVFSNLVENARSFVPDDGGEIRLVVGQRSKRIIVLVEDNGPGIKAENIERIFERFYTDRPANEAFGQNSGLGLSISRQIIEAHGGTLTAENIVGTKPGDIRGARFVVTLPAD